VVSYERLVAEGEKQLSAGQLAAARASFERAAGVQLFEVPNYEILLRVADVRCRQGDRDGGRAVLGDFRCMLDIDGGRQRCYLDAAREHANPALSGDCFARMCGEMYLSYYDFPTALRLQRIETLRRRADDVVRSCSVPPKPR